MLHQGHVRLSLPENSIANLRAQIVWHCHPQTKTHLHMVHSHAPRLGSGMAFTTFCGITCDREGKGWEGVESRVGSGDHVRVWLQHVATCLWSSGLGGGWAVYIHLVPSIVRSHHERRLFSQSREQRRPMDGGDSGLFQWLFPVTKVTKGDPVFQFWGATFPTCDTYQILSRFVFQSSFVLRFGRQKTCPTCHSSKWGHKRTKGHKQEKMDHKSKSSKKEIPRKIQKEQNKNE